MSTSLENHVDITNLPAWARKMYQESWDDAMKLAKLSRIAEYQVDPVRFGNEILNHHYYIDVEDIMKSVVVNPITVAKSATGVGKAQPKFAKVLTPDGYRCIGDLEIGDEVIGRDGKATKVTHLFPQGIIPTYRILFSDGSSVLCSADHLWVAQSKHDKYRQKGWQFYTTNGLEGVINRCMHIPICEPVQFPYKNYFIHPYILGVLIGDGGLTQQVTFTSDDPWIVDLVSTLLPAGTYLKYRKKGITYGIGGALYKNQIKTELVKLGLMFKHSADKFIPDSYMLGDISQRKDLLAGLLDTDGTIDSKGSIIYTTISKRLAEQVVELVNTLGGTATTGIKKCSYVNKKGKRIEAQLAYNVYIKLPFNPFTLPRKSKRYKNGTIRKLPHRVVNEIEYVGDFDSICIRIDSPEQLYLTEHCIVTHNSYASADIALWWFYTFEDAEVYMTAAPPLENLKNILWGEMLYTVRNRPDIFRKFTVNELQIKRHDKSAIHGVTIPMTGTREERIGKFSGKHAPHLLFIVDEGDAVPSEIYEAIEGCMSGGMARLLIMFNPKAQQGPVYQMEIDQRARFINLSSLRHPNVVTGEDIIPGAVTRETVVRRINQWTRPVVEGEEPTASRRFDVPDFLVGAVANSLQGIPYPPLEGGTRVIMESAFSYMILGQYPEQGENQLISPEWIKSARKRWDDYVAEHGERPPSIRPRMGLDVAEFGQDFNAAILRYGNYVPKIGRIWQGVDPTVSGEKTAELCRLYNVDVLLVDGTGYGSSIAPQISKLVKGLRCVSVKVAGKPSVTITSELGEFFQIRDQMWWACREWLREEEAMLPPEPMLLEELMTPTYRIDDRGKIHLMDKDSMREKLKRSPNYADALVLTFVPAERAKVQMLVGE